MTKRAVYVVDDEEPVRRALKLMLTVGGYSATAFYSGAALLDAAADLPPGAVLLDVRMADMDGIEVQRRLASLGIALPVIVMTGHGDLAVAAAALQQGAVAFLEKPFSRPVLADALEAAFLKLDSPAAYEERRGGWAARVAALPEEDRALLASVAAGLSNEKIAQRLGIGPTLVEVRRARLFAELGVDTIGEALRMACAAGLQGPEALRDTT